ncbi:MAG: type I-B CRISPR-associated protein Cas8b1/Cst1 [Clostridium sp.]
MVKVYNSDNWFYKQGLVGFDRIIQYNKQFHELDILEFNYKINRGSIEFDVGLLQDFHKYYFNYFLGRYNSADEQSEKLIAYLIQCKEPQKFKDNLKYVKEVIKKNNDKIKKFEVEQFNECDRIYKELGFIKKPEQIIQVEELVNQYIELLKISEINLRITLNKFKAMLSGNFFGQVSFLNVSHTSKSFEEQENILFKDYIAPIMEMESLKKVLREEDEALLNKYVEELSKEDKKYETDVDKLIKNINNGLFGKKRKVESVDDIIGKQDICSMCDDELSLGSNYGEGSFIPLGLSNGNSRNMFWDLNAKYPICPLCRLILLCTAAGSTDIFKSYLDDKFGYNEKLYFGFISLDGALDDLIKQNNNFLNRVDKKSNFEAYVLDSIGQQKEISQWQLENILYIEFNTDYNSKNSKMNYFNIPKYLVKFLKNNSYLLYDIKDRNLRMEIFDNILAGKDLKHLIDRKIRGNFDESNRMKVNILALIKIRSCLKLYKGECEMVDKSFDKKLNFLYIQGFEISNILRNSKQENKIPGLTYRLLNATKAGNKKEFMDTAIRVFMSVGMEVPMILLEVMKERELDFEEVAHSFISGLTSKKNIKGEEKGAV